MFGDEGTDYAVERGTMVAMRDGVRLATDIYRPLRNGQPVTEPLPVILERTPYGRDRTSRAERTAARAEPFTREEVAAYFVRHGYVVVYQDCRGRFGSEGTFVKYLSDAADGFDTIAWLIQQEWCNRLVGTMGLSYAAHTQAAAASLNPPGLAAMFLDSGGFSNAFHSGIRQGGAFELKQATWAFTNAKERPAVQADPVAKAALAATDIRAWFRRMPWKRGHSPLTVTPEYEDYLFEQWASECWGPYWQQAGIWAEGFYDQFSDVPQVHMSSWYDPYTRTASDNYQALSRRKRGPVRLILGPWTHGDRSQPHAGDVDFGPNATLDGSLAEDFLALRLRWFDRWMRGVDNGVQDEPAVRYFRMGGGSGRRNDAERLDHGGVWRQAADWPLPTARVTPFYLLPDGSLSEVGPPVAGGPDVAATSAGRSFDSDPRRPVPTIGGNISSGQPVMVGGGFDQVESQHVFGAEPPYLPLASRPDVLVFSTAPLTEDVEVTGPTAVHLWVSSNCPDTDITVKLIDQYPPSADYPHGFALNLCDGILRLRFRDSWEAPSLLTPGQVYAVTVQPFPTSNLFRRGHRIRLDIAGSNFPHFDVNPNTGGLPGFDQTARIATTTIHMSAEHPSHLLLPVVDSVQS